MLVTDGATVIEVEESTAYNKEHGELNAFNYGYAIVVITFISSTPFLVLNFYSTPLAAIFDVIFMLSGFLVVGGSLEALGVGQQWYTSPVIGSSLLGLTIAASMVLGIFSPSLGPLLLAPIAIAATISAVSSLVVIVRDKQSWQRINRLGCTMPHAAGKKVLYPLAKARNSAAR